MSKFLNAFFEMKNEADSTKKFALAAIAIITISLAMLSICGAWALSESGEGFWGFAGSFIPRLFYAALVLGLEMLAAVLFVRALVAANWAQAAVCCGMLLFLAWANVQNAKDGVHFIFPTRFAETGQTLDEKAKLAAEEAAILGTAQTAAMAGSGAELERVRTDIAKLDAERAMLSNQSPEGIQKAQSHLQAMGLYFGREDGVSDILTEKARRQRGEQIAGELAILKARENAFMSGQASPVQQVTTDKRLQQIELAAAAREATASGWRLEVILWVAEIARSLGLWAAVASIRLGSNASGLRRREELEEEEHQNALAELRAKRTTTPPVIENPPTPEPEPAPAFAEPDPIPEPLPVSQPEPVEAIAEPEPPPPPPEPEPIPEPSDAQRWGREGGKQAALNRKAESARAGRVLVIGPVSTLDALKVAAE